jgi:hypothetical protein
MVLVVVEGALAVLVLQLHHQHLEMVALVFKFLLYFKIQYLLQVIPLETLRREVVVWELLDLAVLIILPAAVLVDMMVEVVEQEVLVVLEAVALLVSLGKVELLILEAEVQDQMLDTLPYLPATVVPESS